MHACMHTYKHTHNFPRSGSAGVEISREVDIKYSISGSGVEISREVEVLEDEGITIFITITFTITITIKVIITVTITTITIMV